MKAIKQYRGLTVGNKKQERKVVNRCRATKVDGTQCKAPGIASKENLCNLHYSKKHGKKLPQDYRKKRTNVKSIHKTLLHFGMSAADIHKLRKAYPQLETAVIGDSHPEAALDTIFRLMLLKLAIEKRPSADQARACIVIGQFLMGQRKDIHNAQWKDVKEIILQPEVSMDIELPDDLPNVDDMSHDIDLFPDFEGE